MKTEPIIYCKYKAREKSVVLAAVDQNNGTVVLFLRNSVTVVTKRKFAVDYVVVEKPVNGLPYLSTKLFPNSETKPKKDI